MRLQNDALEVILKRADGTARYERRRESVSEMLQGQTVGAHPALLLGRRMDQAQQRAYTGGAEPPPLAPPVGTGEGKHKAGTLPRSMNGAAIRDRLYQLKKLICPQ